MRNNKGVNQNGAWTLHYPWETEGRFLSEFVPALLTACLEQPFHSCTGQVSWEVYTSSSLSLCHSHGCKNEQAAASRPRLQHCHFPLGLFRFPS